MRGEKRESEGERGKVRERKRRRETTEKRQIWGSQENNEGGAERDIKK